MSTALCRLLLNLDDFRRRDDYNCFGDTSCQADCSQLVNKGDLMGTREVNNAYLGKVSRLRACPLQGSAIDCYRDQSW